MDDRELDELLDWLLDAKVVSDRRLRAAIRLRAKAWRERRPPPLALPRRGSGVVLGIDVSAAHGLDVVVMDGDQRPLRVANLRVDALERLIAECSPDAIAIDSPPAWGRSGKSRQAERGLARLGVSAYAVPTGALRSRFHRWMEVGFASFAAAARAGYPRYVDGPALRTALEVFPYASAVALAGYRRRFTTEREKFEWRRDVLADAGVQTALLRTIDQVDAALAAVTALRALGGTFVAIGDPVDGVIAVPLAALPARGWPLRAERSRATSRPRPLSPRSA